MEKQTWLHGWHWGHIHSIAVHWGDVEFFLWWDVLSIRICSHGTPRLHNVRLCVIVVPFRRHILLWYLIHRVIGRAIRQPVICQSEWEKLHHKPQNMQIYIYKLFKHRYSLGLWLISCSICNIFVSLHFHAVFNLNWYGNIENVNTISQLFHHHTTHNLP